MNTSSAMSGPTTVVFGDLTGWRSRLVYRSTASAAVTVSRDGRFASVPVRGEQRVGALVTPAGHPELVVYLGGDLPEQPLSPQDGWEPADMPTGVVAEMVETDVLAVAWQGNRLVGYCRTVWLDRTYRPMERFSMPVSQPLDGPATVSCRVLEADRDPFLQGSQTPCLVVSVQDAAPLVEQGWELQDWIAVRSLTWRDLDALSHCIEVKAHPLLGEAILAEVVVHDLMVMDIDSLPLLPRDVRDGLERALVAIPD